ncbi:MAG: hypothetical protein DI628_02375 [Blastochloris viridis]|uniref:Lipoprotein n=1 Tax=Blastochloris viridis TaxID=1079 RepID=A0A6N4RCN8_BLAVI|nr:MAG: hypothetical protein DI628_02375 [Blastochloris viridis]
MFRFIALFALLITVAGCSQFGGRIQEIGPNTYRITHSMGPSSPVKGVRQGVIDRATDKCAKTGQNYTKLREEMTPGRTLDYTLFFQCNPQTAPVNK